MTIALVKDANGVTAIGGALNVDGKTVIAILGNETNGSINAVDGTTGINLGGLDLKDIQSHPTIMLRSSTSSKVFPASVDSSGNLLVKSI